MTLKLTDFLTFGTTIKVNNTFYKVFSKKLIGKRNVLLKDIKKNTTKLIEINDFIQLFAEEKEKDMLEFIQKIKELYTGDKIEVGNLMEQIEKEQYDEKLKEIINIYGEMNTYFYLHGIKDIVLRDLLDNYIINLKKKKMIEVSKRKICEDYGIDKETLNYYKQYERFFIKDDKEKDKEYPYSLYGEKNNKLELIAPNKIVDKEYYKRGISDEVDEIQAYIDTKDTLNTNDLLKIYSIITNKCSNISKKYKNNLVSIMSANFDKDYKKNQVEVVKHILKDLRIIK